MSKVNKEQRKINKLTSSNILDVFQIPLKGYWEHGCGGQALVGEEMIIHPNKSLLKMHPVLEYCVIKGTISKIEEPKKQDKNWVSNKIDGSNQKYVIRYHLENIQQLSINDKKYKKLIEQRAGNRGTTYQFIK
jgi:hypothetical protein